MVELDDKFPGIKVVIPGAVRVREMTDEVHVSNRTLSTSIDEQVKALFFISMPPFVASS